MDYALKAQLTVLAVFLTMAATAGCISWLSAEPQPDGSAVVCAKVEPTPDAGAQQGAGPTMVYVPANAPAGTAAPPR